MRTVIKFSREWYSDASDHLRRADPLLMGAAFAFNALFALLPLALAFVTVLTIFEVTYKVLDELYALMRENLPLEVAEFLIKILVESVDTIQVNRSAILVITVLIALWSGSRAVYAIQKALRLVDDSGVTVSYLVMRSTGVAVTFAAGVAVVLGYTVLLTGNEILGYIAAEFGAQGQLIAQLWLICAAALWVFALLTVIYRWGAPSPLPHPALTAAIVTVTMFVGTWAAIDHLPTNIVASIAVLGVIGVVLLWLYGVGVLVVGGPIVIGALMRVLDSGSRRKPESVIE